jgi:2-polyprenyl-6-methoxyphenol hydroxylase-like FAD-dependent oxidoreductase
MSSPESATPSENIRTQCCIVGGGPAGMMLGFLLARAGIDVVVLEKHSDFLRDFRGDTIHPSTLQVMHELGLLDEFLKRPHNKVRELDAQFGDERMPIADFTHLPTVCKFVALMPQWDFLNFVAEHGKRYPGFHLLMETEGIDLIDENGRVVGVRARNHDRALEIRADLVVGTDGRHSTIRARAGFQVMDIGAPMDVLWMRLSRLPNDPPQTLGRIDAGQFLIMLDRGDYWQCAFVIRKGSFAEIQRRGIEAFQADLARLVPYLGDRAREIGDWKKISLLSVAVDRLRVWYCPGLLCIGDSAHAMSPIGGVGINLAIQDAIAAANILAPRLRNGPVGVDALREVQTRREFPTRMTQGLQVFAQNRFVSRVLDSHQQMPIPLFLKLVRRSAMLRRMFARVVGMGFRPEHVHTPEAPIAQASQKSEPRDGAGPLAAH